MSPIRIPVLLALAWCAWVLLVVIEIGLRTHEDGRAGRPAATASRDR